MGAVQKKNGAPGQAAAQSIPSLKAAIEEHKQFIDLYGRQLSAYRWKGDYGERAGMLLEKARSIYSRHHYVPEWYARAGGGWRRKTPLRPNDSEGAREELEAAGLLAKAERILSGVAKSLEITLRRWQRGE